MIETIPSISPREHANMSKSVRVLAQQQAIKAVKRALAAKGLKLQHILKREIVAATDKYLANHPELISETKEIVERWQAEKASSVEAFGAAPELA